MDLQRLGRHCGRTVTPQFVDQPLGRERFVDVQEQQRQQRALLAPAQRYRLPVVERLERTEDAELHGTRNDRGRTTREVGAMQLESLAALVGTWEIEARHPMVPDMVVAGQAEFEWFDGEKFLVQRSHVEHPDFPNSLSIPLHATSLPRRPADLSCHHTRRRPRLLAAVHRPDRRRRRHDRRPLPTSRSRSGGFSRTAAGRGRRRSRSPRPGRGSRPRGRSSAARRSVPRG